jgi:UDP-N-acetylmuramyl pentapeptide phosphotransferase/UDP-N-acetylglucosamine-1-phosphate transferase
VVGDYNTVVFVLLLVFCCNWRRDNAVFLCGIAIVLVLVTSGLDDWYSNKYRGNCIKQTIGGTKKILQIIKLPCI